MKSKIEQLKLQVKGEIILPDDKNYDEARTIYNAMIDKHPSIIFKCKDVDDVITGLNFARENGLEVSIRSGGHNGAGLALVEDGLVIDLSSMKDIEVNPQNRTVKVQPGNTLRDLDKATHTHGFAVPVGVNGTTGVAGLTLGGGLGYLSRKGGLAIDNLLEAEVVLASGELVTANASSHSDLFWALRGGGGNFGIVTSFTFNLIPITNVYAGPMFWPMEQAAQAMKFYDEVTKNTSNDLYGFFAFLMVPPGDPFPKELHSQKVCGIVWCYTGAMEKAEEVFKPIREFGPPILDWVGEMPMPALNGLFDDLYPEGLHWYWRAHYINELTDKCIEENIKFGASVPNFHSTTHFYPIDGKVHETGEADTAWAHRNNRWVQVIIGITPDPSEVDKVTQWCKAYHAGVTPYAEGGAYVNFMMKEGQDRVKAGYKGNYERLVQIKTKYDPTNFFHINQNIKPTN